MVSEIEQHQRNAQELAQILSEYMRKIGLGEISEIEKIKGIFFIIIREDSCGNGLVGAVKTWELVDAILSTLVEEQITTKETAIQILAAIIGGKIAEKASTLH